MPVPIGELTHYAVEIRETAIVIRARHRLVLEISGQDTQTQEPVWYHTCNPVRTLHTQELGGSQGSYLLVPEIAANDLRLAADFSDSRYFKSA